MATPNMNLTEIVPGVTPGPTYATNIVSNFSTIDSHDHTTGKGVRVPSSGLNINADLPFGGNGATGLGKSQFNSLSGALSAAGDYRSVHVVNGELFYLDGSGNSVQITSSGSVSGSTGNITGLSSPASVTFSTNKYVFKDTATSFAIMESSDVRLFEDAAGAITNYVALKSPASLAATYSLTMPAALPAGDRYVQSDNSGDLSFVDADSIGSAMTEIGSNAIAAVRTRATGTSVAAGGVGIAIVNSFTTTSTSFVSVTGMSVTITTSGRPVRLELVGASGTSPNSQIRVSDSGSLCSSFFRFTRGGSNISGDRYLAGTRSVGTEEIVWSGLTYVDVVAAGTYTYAVQINGDTSASSVTFQNIALIAYEL
jgi:hypothetical protein